MSGPCLNCKAPILLSEHTIKGEPAVCSWAPPGGGRSVYAIVTVHLRCMTVPQLRQALASWEEETRQRGYPAVIVNVVERRLAELLALSGACPTCGRGSAEPGDGIAPPAVPTRFDLLETD